MAVASAPKTTTQAKAWRSPASLLQDVALIALSTVFFVVHASHLAQGHFSATPFAIEQGMLVVIFLCRRRSRVTSTRPYDWAVASIGGWLPLVLQPQDAGGADAVAAGLVLQTAGFALSLCCFGFLGRSFGIVAADRGLKTKGPYSVVRHPIYLGHTLSTTGFLVANWSLLNAVVVAVVMVSQLLRIAAEERLLTSSNAYGDYRRTVRWRLVPFVY